MRATVKITTKLLAEVRADLARPHPFAHERVGFLRTAAAWAPEGLMILCRDYLPVEDGDYERTTRYGAQIGSEAMRKAAQAAYVDKTGLLHIHTHGGVGRPEFSRPDMGSAPKFVPGFFNSVARLPHGIVVLSDDSARGLIWIGKKDSPFYVDGFVEVGPSLRKVGKEVRHGAA